MNFVLVIARLIYVGTHLKIFSCSQYVGYSTSVMENLFTYQHFGILGVQVRVTLARFFLFAKI